MTTFFNLKVFTPFLLISALVLAPAPFVSPLLASEKSPTDLPFAIFGGIEGGYHWVDANALGFSDSLKGPLFGGKIGGTYDHSLFTASASIGWTYARNSAETRRNGSSLYDVNSTTRAGFLEFSPRAKLVKTLELGPYVRWMFGTNSAFGDLGQSKDNTPLLGGLMTTYAFNANPFQVRVGASFGTDLNLTDRQVYVAIVGIELGFPFYEVQGDGRRIKTKIVEKIVIQEAMNFVLDDQVLHFEKDKSELNAASVQFMKELATYLSSNQDAWASLRVEGHTDNRGSDKYNQALSERRAETIKSMLIAAGVAQGKVTAEGKGESKPIAVGETEKAWAANRRIEMIFKGIKDPENFRSEVNRIKFRAFAE